MTDSECALAHVVAQATGLLDVWAMLLGSAQEKMLQKSRQDTNPGSADLAAACAVPANPILSSPCLLEFFSQFKFPRKHKTQFVLMQPTQECCVEEHGSHLPACPPPSPCPAQHSCSCGLLTVPSFFSSHLQIGVWPLKWWIYRTVGRIQP